METKKMTMAETIVKLQGAPEWFPEPVDTIAWLGKGVLFVCADKSEVLNTWKHLFEGGKKWAINTPENFHKMMGRN